MCRHRLIASRVRQAKQLLGHRIKHDGAGKEVKRPDMQESSCRDIKRDGAVKEVQKHVSNRTERSEVSIEANYQPQKSSSTKKFGGRSYPLSPFSVDSADRKTRKP